MKQARKHRRLLSGLAFGLLALAAELIGRSLTHRIDVGRHLASPSYAGADYYPILVGAVKVGIALLAARLAWRVARARSAERAACRLLAAVDARPARAVPRPRARLSPRLWACFFALTSLIYLVQADAEQATAGRWPLLAPWLYSSALPVFAVVAVLVALAWSVVQRWLADYERYAEEATEHVRRLAAGWSEPRTFSPQILAAPPRRLFGLVFESRPPPARA